MVSKEVTREDYTVPRRVGAFWGKLKSGLTDTQPMERSQKCTYEFITLNYLLPIP